MERVSENSSFVAVTSYPSSESGGELEIANQWLEKSIEKEIRRGEKLRDDKLYKLQSAKPSNTGSSNKLKLASDNNRIPSTSVKDLELEKMRKRARSISPLQKSPLSRDARSASGARAGRPMCSMRINELAAPSKRQVIDTWRNKAAVLPEFMVYRLRQQIFDQKPIVQVTDAVTCFKYERKSPTRRPPRRINKEGLMRRTMTENQCMSTIFGHKIAQKLITPKSINLDNPYYKNISTIVSDDILKLVKDRRRLRTDDTTHARMVQEVADKVTVWIAGILEDTSEKLLEEDLKVKKMRDRTSATDAELITLIGTMACKEAELEEQEGPVLDLLDDLVDNVVDSFKRDSVSSFSQMSSYDVAQEDNEKDKIGTLSPDYISADSQSDEDAASNGTVRTETKSLPIPGTLDNTLEEIRESKSDYSMNTYFKDQINDIIASNAFGTQSLDEERSESGLSTARSQPDIDDSNAISKAQTPSIHSDSFASIFSQKSKHEEKLETDDNIDPVINNENEDNSNVSDALAILNEESEERNKKVQFSHDNLGALKEMDQFGSISRKQEPNSLTIENLPVHTVKEITYAPPNEHVLSDADDLWPDNISPFAIKPSASVSKSITSMGKILESDEKYIPTPEEEQSQDLLPEPPESAELQEDIENKDLIPQAPQPLESTEMQDLETRDTLDTNYKNNASDALHSILYDGLNQNKLTDLKKDVSKEDLIPQAPQPLESTEMQDLETRDTLDTNYENNASDALHSILYDGSNQTKLTDLKSDVSKEDLIPQAPQPLESTEMQDFETKDSLDDNNASAALHSILYDGSKQNELADLKTDVSKTKKDFEEFQEFSGKNDRDHEYVMDDFVSSNQEQPFLQETDTKSIGSSEYSLDLDFDLDLLKNNVPVEKKESTSKPDVCDKKDSSRESFVSLVVGELKKYSDVLQVIISDREQAKMDSLVKVQSPQFERSKSVENIKRSPTSSKTHQRRLSADVRHTKKFDYRVHQKTAPAWIRRGQGEPIGGCHKRCGCQTDVTKSAGVKTLGKKWRCPDPPGAKTMEQREKEIRKWCKDLDNILLNLSKWKNWLDYITGYINNLKQKAEYNKLIKPNSKMHPAPSVSNWSKSVNKEVWTKLNQRAKGGLKLYRLDDLDETIKFKISRSPVPAKYCVKCGKRQAKRLSRSPVRK